MTYQKLRRQIACEAAWLIHSQQETDFSAARNRVAHRLLSGDHEPRALPSDREIRDELQALTRMGESPLVREELATLRSAARQLLATLARFSPRVMGEVLAGIVAERPKIEIELLADAPLQVTRQLGLADYAYEPQLLAAHYEHEQQLLLVIPSVRTVLHCKTDLADYELDSLADVSLHVYMKTGAARREWRLAEAGDDTLRATREELMELESREYRGVRTKPNIEPAPVNRWLAYRSLLLPLEEVKQPPRLHPEGDALYHSLQVFEIVREQASYDEELQLAALLHDVGKAIDAVDPRAAALEALAGLITERTHWLIEHLAEAELILTGEIGARAHRRLKESEDFDDLMLLARANRAGRKSGIEVCDVDEALVFIQLLAADDEEDDEDVDESDVGDVGDLDDDVDEEDDSIEDEEIEDDGFDESDDD